MQIKKSFFNLKMLAEFFPMSLKNIKKMKNITFIELII
jgi:hypothetical protein